MKQVELLAPAGSLEIFYAVLHAGADAVYLGGQAFGARAYASNFSQEEIVSAINYAHLHGKKVYLTVNTLVKEDEYEKLYLYMVPYVKAQIDGVIVQDIGVLAFLHQFFPALVLHSSTQMSIASVEGANYMKSLGVTRIVPARELSLEELSEIHSITGMELETFIHGALCYCYSGQCLFSSILGGRSGNRGRCTQPCRLPYTVYRNQTVIGNHGYWLSMKDLNTIHEIPQIIQAGVCSLKIEGRMKQKEYAAGVVSIYRKYLDMAQSNQPYQVKDFDERQLLAYGNRGNFTDGYYTQHNGKKMITVQTSNYQKDEKFPFNTEVESSPRQIGITGVGYFEVGKPSTLTIQGNGQMITVDGDLVEAAKNKPMTKEMIEKKCRKTGATNFEFESLNLTVVGDVFIPVSAINALRRKALDELELALIGQQAQMILPYEQIDKKVEEPLSPKLSVSIDHLWQVEIALSSTSVSRLYLNTASLKQEEIKQLLHSLSKNNSEIELYFTLPWMMRQENNQDFLKQIHLLDWSFVKGLVVGSVDGYAIAKKLIKEFSSQNKLLEIITDPSLYQFSNYTKDILQVDSSSISLPYELNRKELRKVINPRSEFSIYGYIPLMISAGCVHQNATGCCDKKEELLHLEDRYQKHFPVRNFCKVCYNVIYNSSPLCLLQSKDELDDLNINRYCIHLTIENREETEEVMKLVQRVFDQKEHLTPAQIPFEYTKGHYKRGVE